MHQTFVRTSQGVIRLEYVSFVRNIPANGIEIFLVGEEASSLMLYGFEANRFLGLLPVAIDISTANQTMEKLPTTK
ncbi:MAG TPA: hypothetical protein V6D26_05615 [Stenomitos sp.]|nr:hypothetical protein [Kamptonema sp.]